LSIYNNLLHKNVPHWGKKLREWYKNHKKWVTWYGIELTRIGEKSQKISIVFAVPIFLVLVAFSRCYVLTISGNVWYSSLSIYGNLLSKNVRDYRLNATWLTRNQYHVTVMNVRRGTGGKKTTRWYWMNVKIHKNGKSFHVRRLCVLAFLISTINSDEKSYVTKLVKNVFRKT